MQNTQEIGAGALGPNWEGPYKIAKILQSGTYQFTKMDGTELPRAWNTEHM